jgi:GTP pyrophosphokinase
MVAVLNASPVAADASRIDAWLEAVTRAHSPADRDRLRLVLEHVLSGAGVAGGEDGEPLADRALGTAAIVAGLRLDADAVSAALLSALPAADLPAAEAIAARFGAGVAELVQGVERMSQIQTAQPAATPDDRARQAEALRKMLLAMVKDVRVVLIKLAERLQALRFLVGRDEARARDAARAVLDVFAPLANRLGVWQLKWELEDLSLRALEPQTYKEIARLLDERRLDRERFIEEVVATLRRELAAAGVAADVSGRPKHIYSIYSKMRRKGSGIEELYDIRAVRILVPEVKDCYAALGVVHNLWTPLPREFDDYIAKPKPNNYRSLHTAVIGPEGKPLEVQIRTHAMHRHSEYGVAAHWRYKEGGGRADPGFDDRIAWLRQVLEWRDEVADAPELIEHFKSALFTDVIYVLTPQGRVVDLPAGSTPVDFAYAVHTSLGHRCRGARVDGAIVPLGYRLANGQTVEIVAAKQGGPSRDWLNAELGFVQSHRARAKVRQWFKTLQLEQTLGQGRAIVERELQREGLTGLNLEACAAAAGFGKLEDFFVAVGRAEVNARQLQIAVRSAANRLPQAAAAEPEAVTRAPRAGAASSGILVVGVDKLLTALARCCKPAPPDRIIGFVTRGKGISVHRRDCANVARMRAGGADRLIEADWGTLREEVFPVDVEILAGDRQGLLRDVSEVFSRERINVTAVRTLSRSQEARMLFTVEVKSVDHLQRTLANVREVKGVWSAKRL